MRRAALVWAGLFAVYSLVDGAGGGDGRAYVRAAAAIVGEDALGTPAVGVGYALVLAAGAEVGGATGAALLSSALSALAFVPALALARRLVPEPWATGGVVVCALSPPALALGASVSPALPAGGLLAAAVVLGLRLRGDARVRDGVAAGVPLAALPWLGEELLLPAAAVGAALLAWTWRRGRAVVAITALEVLAASLLTLVRVNDALYGGFTHHASHPAGGSELAVVDLARWLPVVALAALGAAMLARSRRSRIARAVAERATAEAAACAAVAVLAGAVAAGVVAGFIGPGAWPVSRQLGAALPCAGALAAWGLRGFPRLSMVAAVGTLAGSVALLALGDLGPGA